MFEGSGVALVTPFLKGQVDKKALEELVEFQIADGTSFLVPCGTTGESSTLSHEEHAQVIEWTVVFAKGRVPVLAGTGSNSTRETIELTQHAKKAGAQGSLLIAPYYNKPTQRGLLEHFRAVARAVDGFPLIIYNIPGRTSINVLPTTVIELAQSEKNIVGIKEASGSLDQATEILRALGDDFALLSGDDSLTLPLLSIGAKGVISVTANLFPKDVAALCAHWKKGRTKEAQALHRKMFPLIKALFLETNPIPVKTAMEMLKRCSGELRLPLVPMEEENKKVLAEHLKNYQSL